MANTEYDPNANNPLLRDRRQEVAKALLLTAAMPVVALIGEVIEIVDTTGRKIIKKVQSGKPDTQGATTVASGLALINATSKMSGIDGINLAAEAEIKSEESDDTEIIAVGGGRYADPSSVGTFIVDDSLNAGAPNGEPTGLNIFEGTKIDPHQGYDFSPSRGRPGGDDLVL